MTETTRRLDGATLSLSGPASEEAVTAATRLLLRDLQATYGQLVELAGRVHEQAKLLRAVLDAGAMS